ncbi:hypothetical protein [Streptomyces sp. NBC_01006]|uniref:hypothetical protein n=1 Tax=Streptomyces sp. NBC_01006 TaxID=2903716 RepID=UPI0038650DBA|nr:hypothetical protein OG509_32390 [Streptomyces sp. NBC_01006]
MSASTKPTSLDDHLEEAFGAPLAQLYVAAEAWTASPPLQRALALRSFLALAEEQVTIVRDTIHLATAADRDPGVLSSDAMRFDAQWLGAALVARDRYTTALGELLRTMPPPAAAREGPPQITQPKIATRAAPGVPPVMVGSQARSPWGH